MARVYTGNCQACNGKFDNIVGLSNGEYFCPNCLVERIHDGSMFVGRPDQVVSCSGCGDDRGVDNEVYCLACYDANYESGTDDAYSYCVSCDRTAEYCERCADNMGKTTRCGECGEEVDWEDLYTYCISCMSELHAECGMGLSSPIVTEEGNATFTDMEIVW